ncbi:hypothetical protein CHCC15337_0279 [Bacillus paralicheniformis]|uniref:Uncharacterized protein n=1 Tax=Bacillus paralicheniformis TaxID=1648923 RepID=A0ABY3FUG2_9BACI|nr:hypothetical protein CHCC5021_1615 [Bacillus paralicheniformis]TWL09610.1 hypothetical protein CHCC19468_1821 [Bacillus paralicheniformis]TWL19146.1 hypothetical protein CHCC19467_3843 [Bacillus paralicheniformis]TWL36065.1 hypothetical protein CHCC15381_4414 [Bacillus paralicheniformis]TWL42916.1 hypothetical protein CHCC15337_0279 [Bacillus paralicheniformis]
MGLNVPYCILKLNLSFSVYQYKMVSNAGRDISWLKSKKVFHF